MDAAVDGSTDWAADDVAGVESGRVGLTGDLGHDLEGMERMMRNDAG